MAKIESACLDLSYLDALAASDSPVHRLDPRIKVLTAALFVVCVVSFDKYVIAAMSPFALFLSLVVAFSGIPVEFILKKLALVSPFALFLAMFNPLLDQQTHLYLGTFPVSGGWLSFFSILLRCCLTAGAMLLLVAVTGFQAVCMALEKLGMPKIFAVQLLLLYRYLFVLMEEGRRIYRARELRVFQGRGLGVRTFGSLIGGLLLRTLERAQRIHLAMLCRGFDGTIRTRNILRLTIRDLAVFVICCLLLGGMRSRDCSLLLVQLLTGWLR